MMFRMSDIPCGTKSVSKAFESLGWETFTLDIVDSFDPTVCTDFLEWDYKVFPRDHFDMMWFSPICTAFSMASGSYHFRKKGKVFYPISETAQLGVNMVKKMLKMWDYFDAPYKFMENPLAKLHKMDFMWGKSFKIIWYCKYGDIAAKPTVIFYSKLPKGMIWKKCHRFTDMQIKGKSPLHCHHEIARQGMKTGTQGKKNRVERGRLPKEFCQMLARSVTNELNKR